MLRLVTKDLYAITMILNFENLQRQAIQDEVHRKQEALRAEGRQRRESLRHNQDPSTNYTHGLVLTLFTFI